LDTRPREPRSAKKHALISPRTGTRQSVDVKGVVLDDEVGIGVGRDLLQGRSRPAMRAVEVEPRNAMVS